MDVPLGLRDSIAIRSMYCFSINALFLIFV